MYIHVFAISIVLVDVPPENVSATFHQLIMAVPQVKTLVDGAEQDYCI